MHLCLVGAKNIIKTSRQAADLKERLNLTISMHLRKVNNMDFWTDPRITYGLICALVVAFICLGAFTCACIRSGQISRWEERKDDDRPE